MIDCNLARNCKLPHETTACGIGAESHKSKVPLRSGDQDKIRTDAKIISGLLTTTDRCFRVGFEMRVARWGGKNLGVLID